MKLNHNKISCIKLVHLLYLYIGSYLEERLFMDPTELQNVHICVCNETNSGLLLIQKLHAFLTLLKVLMCR